MASVPVCEVVEIKTGKALVINESDFDSALYKRGKGAGEKSPAPLPLKKKSSKFRKGNKS